MNESATKVPLAGAPPVGTGLKCLQCGKPFTLKPAARHKKFCSAKCRNTWHMEVRKKAVAEYLATHGGEADEDA